MTNYDWNNFLDFSSWLLGFSGSSKPDDETISRVAISRAYYAAYHAAKDYLTRKGYDKEIYAGGEHEIVCKTLKEMNKGDKQHKASCRSIGNNLTILKKERHKCDYNSNESISLKNAQQSCGKALNIIQAIAKL